MAGDLKAEYEKCRKRYPTVDLSYEDFSARIQASGNPAACSCSEDLFLATACARGDRIAWEYFADDYVPLLHRMAARACRQNQEGEDLAQEIVASLMGDKSKLAGYGGRCSLAGWLRVTLSHALIDRLRRRRREVSLEESNDQGQEIRAASPQSNGQSDSLDAAWGPVLADVLKEQIRLLPPRDRLILGLYYVHGVSLKVIGRHFEIHEATVSRWLESLRQTVRKRVERELRARHNLKAGDIRGLWQWVAEHDLLRLSEILGRECGVQTLSETATGITRGEGKT